MAIDVFGDAIQGKRKKQEDNIFYQVKNNVGMAVVCDGMGGLDEGDWASHIAVELMKKHFNHRNTSEKIQDFYIEEIKHLDEVICQLEDEERKQIISGTTYVSAIIENDKLYWASVGDSKIFLYKNNCLTDLAQTHNYKLQLDQALEKGEITEQKYISELKNADCLISYLGVGNLEYYDISEEPTLLLNGDLVILCSDGVFNTLNEQEIINIINGCSSAQDIVEQIIHRIEIKNIKGQDNASLIVLKYEE